MHFLRLSKFQQFIAVGYIESHASNFLLSNGRVPLIFTLLGTLCTFVWFAFFEVGHFHPPGFCCPRPLATKWFLQITHHIQWRFSSWYRWRFKGDDLLPLNFLILILAYFNKYCFVTTTFCIIVKLIFHSTLPLFLLIFLAKVAYCDFVYSKLFVFNGLRNHFSLTAADGKV